MSTNGKQKETVKAVSIRFAGDSGDGIQITGGQFTTASAIAGNDLATLPDFPAEIRAPAGSLAGVSGFQIQFASTVVFTPGDQPDVLVAMNPAALQRNYKDVREGGIIIVDTHSFTEKNLLRAGFHGNPLEDGTLSGWQLFEVKITKMTQTALKDEPLSNKEILRCKNFFALGLMFWLYNRPMDPTLRWLESKFAKRPQYIVANQKVLKAGYNFGDITDLFQVQYQVAPAQLQSGQYRKINGTTAAAYGFLVGAKKAHLELFLGAYPITPASDLLHELARHRNFGVLTVQCEDEIAAVGMAIGASYAGKLGLTASSGPGIALKAEAISLAVIVELPLVIASIQRGGPSTGLPTKTEQSDLLQVIFGRNGECPCPVVAASTAGDCFHTALEAVRIATRYMTPVFFLSDGYLANGAEPWLIPNVDDIPEMPVRFRTDPEGYQPYLRNDDLARPWVKVGTPGLEHRVGGLEKEDVTGNVSYDPENHERMTRLRAEKVARIADDLPPTEIYGHDRGELLVIGWGSTYGAIRAACANKLAAGRSVAHVHLRHLNPLPRDLADILDRYKHVLVPELNTGQLAYLLRANYLIETIGLNKVRGLPLTVGEVCDAIERYTSCQTGEQPQATA
jgi:2-oxoglutarate ferredoxin oxidoreductase subunit alpha